MLGTPLTDAAGSNILVPAGTESNSSGVSWPAIISGAAASLALSFLLIILGSGLGLAAVSPWANRGASITSFAMGTGVWLIIVQWLASGLGGYLTGRLRTKWSGLHVHEVFFRDTANGLVTWSVATVASVAIVASAAGFVVNGSTAAAAAPAGAGGTAQTAARIDTSSADPGVYLLDRLFRTDGPVTAAGDADAKAQSGVIIVHGLEQGGVSEADRTYLAQLVSARTGVSPDVASKRVEAAIDGAQAAEIAVQKAADGARKAAAALSIFTALAMLIGAFIACVSAAIGGLQRDEY
jgi:hypothetical protein